MRQISCSFFPIREGVTLQSWAVAYPCKLGHAWCLSMNAGNAFPSLFSDIPKIIAVFYLLGCFLWRFFWVLALGNLQSSFWRASFLEKSLDSSEAIFKLWRGALECHLWCKKAKPDKASNSGAFSWLLLGMEFIIQVLLFRSKFCSTPSELLYVEVAVQLSPVCQTYWNTHSSVNHCVSFISEQS